MPFEKGRGNAGITYQEEHQEEPQINSGPFYEVQSSQKISEYMN